MQLSFADWLFHFPSGQGLKKTNILKAKYLNLEQDSIMYFHITGTNGKGSVSRYLNAILLQNTNLKVGLFTSPHISVLNERIMVNDVMITDEELNHYRTLLEDDVLKYKIGFFPILTIIALMHFQAQKVDVVIMEVGIGGKKDPTNIIKTDYAVITSIGKDHTEYLGRTQKLIMEQKLGIIKPTTKTLFVSDCLTPMLKRQAFASSANVILAPKSKDKDYHAQNKKLAKTIVAAVFPEIPLDNIESTLATTKIMLRFEKIKFNNKTLYFDVAHNIPGVRALIHILKMKRISVDQIIFSSLLTKKPKELLKLLSNNISSNILVCKNYHNNSIAGETFNLEEMIISSTEETILITGSCYFAAEVYNQIKMWKGE